MKKKTKKFKSEIDKELEKISPIEYNSDDLVEVKENINPVNVEVKEVKINKVVDSNEAILDTVVESTIMMQTNDVRGE